MPSVALPAGSVLVCSPSQNDSIEGIYDTLKECAAISKSAGGIGLSIHNIRATVSRAWPDGRCRAHEHWISNELHHACLGVCAVGSSADPLLRR